MYLYFNSDGVLKEVVNDEYLRQGSSGVNFIYAYFEDGFNLDTDIVEFKFIQKSMNITYPRVAVEDDTTMEIPYNPKRDLRFFEYNKLYHFAIIPLSFNIYDGEELQASYNVLSNAVNTGLTIYKNNRACGLVVFDIEEGADGTNEIQKEEYITLAQFQYLLQNEARRDYVDSTFVTLATNQNITGDKTFVNRFFIGDNKEYQIKEDTDLKVLFKTTLGYMNFIIANVNEVSINGNFYPITTNEQDLGSNTYMWKTIYARGLRNGVSSHSLLVPITAFYNEDRYIATTKDLNDGLALKQDTLIAGAGISIAPDGKTISATTKIALSGPYNDLSALQTAHPVGDSNTIYLVIDPNAVQNNRYDEYIWDDINNEYEKIASIDTALNLNAYQKKLTIIDAPESGTYDITVSDYFDILEENGIGNEPYFLYFNGTGFNKGYFLMWSDASGHINFMEVNTGKSYFYIPVEDDTEYLGRVLFANGVSRKNELNFRDYISNESNRFALCSAVYNALLNYPKIYTYASSQNKTVANLYSDIGETECFILNFDTGTGINSFVCRFSSVSFFFFYTSGEKAGRAYVINSNNYSRTLSEVFVDNLNCTLENVATAINGNYPKLVSEGAVYNKFQNIVDSTVQTEAAETVSSMQDRTYAVQYDSNGKAVVNVPWSASGLYQHKVVISAGSDTATLYYFDSSSTQKTSSTWGASISAMQKGFVRGVVYKSSTDKTYMVADFNISNSIPEIVYYDGGVRGTVLLSSTPLTFVDTVSAL